MRAISGFAWAGYAPKRKPLRSRRGQAGRYPCGAEGIPASPGGMRAGVLHKKARARRGGKPVCAARNRVPGKPWMVCISVAGMLFLGAPALGAAAIQWDAPWQVRSNGQHLSVETFSSSLPPDVVARELSRRNGAYQRYLVGDGRILLSGIKPGEHWLAEIQGRSAGSQGYVSALYFDAARSNASSLAATQWGTGTKRGRAAGLLAAGIGLPLRGFEFDSSAFVGLVNLAGGTPGTTLSAGNAPQPNESGSTLGAGLSGRPAFTLIPSESHAAVALAVSVPER